MSEVGYPLVAHHGVIGDLQTAALVSTTGVIDWYCCPRFDSPSVFASLLDTKRGGGFQIAPEQLDTVVIRQLYIPDTATLVTRFMAATGVGEVVDFMPIVGREPTPRLGNFPQAFTHLALIRSAVLLDGQLPRATRWTTPAASG
jgi:GH15 family glucan-1,4-alpha-glucosidase